MANLTPKEKDEQIAFVDWLDRKFLKFTSIPNSTWTPSFKQKHANKQTGLRPGLPDLLILISADKSASRKAVMVFVEMKRKKGSEVRRDQVVWIEKLNEIENVQAQVCYGADEAMDFVRQFLKLKRL